MDANDGMFRLNRFPPDKLAVTPGMVGLRVAAVFGPETREECLYQLREAIVCRCLGCPGRVAAGLGDGEEG